MVVVGGGVLGGINRCLVTCLNNVDLKEGTKLFLPLSFANNQQIHQYVQLHSSCFLIGSQGRSFNLQLQYVPLWINSVSFINEFMVLNEIGVTEISFTSQMWI